MNSIEQSVLEKIKAGEISAKPRWRFRLEALLFSLVAVIVGVGAVYLFSFILFYLHTSGLVYVPSFGFEGILFFVVASPWILIGLSLTFLLLLAGLVKQYSYNYRRPFVTIIVGVVVIVVTASMLLHSMSIHDRVSVFAKRYQVPGMSPLYQGTIEWRYPEVVIGTVVAAQDQQMTITDRFGASRTITLGEKNQSLDIRSGDHIVVFGKTSKEGEMAAVGIKHLSPERYQWFKKDTPPCLTPCPLQ